MSRIGKKPVALVKGVSASISGQTIEVKGPKGTRSFTAGDDVTLSIEGETVKVTPRGLSKRARQQWGMSRSMIQNLVDGVTGVLTPPGDAAALQQAMQLAQRVWNLQPAGGLAGEGMEPSSTIRSIFTVGSGTGMAENRALV